MPFNKGHHLEEHLFQLEETGWAAFGPARLIAEEAGTLEEVSFTLATRFLLATILKVSHIRTGHPISAMTQAWSLKKLHILYTFSTTAIYQWPLSKVVKKWNVNVATVTTPAVTLQSVLEWRATILMSWPHTLQSCLTRLPSEPNWLLRLKAQCL